MISGNDMVLAAAIETIWMLDFVIVLVVFALLDKWLDKAISKKIKKLLDVEG